MRGLAHVLGVAVISAAVGGCDLLTLLGGGGLEPFPSFDPDDPGLFPSPAATFTSGSATIELDGATIQLETVQGSTDPDFGTTVEWSGQDGWHLTFYGYPPGTGLGEDEGSVSMDRVFDDQHWVIYNAERCIATTDRLETDGISGTATCRGIEWSDYFGAIDPFGQSDEIPGQEPFDAEVTFEAH